MSQNAQKTDILKSHNYMTYLMAFWLSLRQKLISMMTSRSDYLLQPLILTYLDVQVLGYLPCSDNTKYSVLGLTDLPANCVFYCYTLTLRKNLTQFRCQI